MKKMTTRIGRCGILRKTVAVSLSVAMIALTGCGASGSSGTTAAGSSANGGGAAASTAAAGTAAAGNTASAGGKTITMAMVSAWDNMMPFDTTSAYSDAIFDLIYDKLVYLKQDGTYYGRLAESWEMNSDNTVLTIKLNQKAKWQDGEPVTADDVVFTSLLYSSPTMATARTNQFNSFAGFGKGDDTLQVKALDTYTVQFTCAEPTNIDFLMFTKFRDVYILPKHLLGNIPYDKIRDSDYWKNPVGSGACIYDSQISGERMEFKANKDYFMGTPQWDRFVVRVVPTPNLLSGLLNGEIDILAGNVGSLQLSDWAMAQSNKDLVCSSVPSVAYQYMAINTSKPYLNDKVRQGINYAINRKVIVDNLLQGQGAIAYGPIPSDSKYYNPVIEAPYDVNKAKALLAEGGWDGSHTLVMSVPTGNTVREQSATIIQQNLADVGVKCQIESADFATHLNKVRKGDYDLGFIGSGGSPDPSECVINFNPDHLNNFSHLSDWTVYNTGAAGQNAFTFEDRKVCYDKYQEELSKQVPFAFLYFTNTLFASRSNIGGVTDVQDFSQLNRDVWNWTIK